jgi:hypothetical protein
VLVPSPILVANVLFNRRGLEEEDRLGTLAGGTVYILASNEFFGGVASVNIHLCGVFSLVESLLLSESLLLDESFRIMLDAQHAGSVSAWCELWSSAKLGSVVSRMSESGRVVDQTGTDMPETN